ncbi:hypothetical protein [Pengzhenrongella sicca]|uniref:Uncharacterized protein n=1 Tax=Pengzhenrongella sicca TaxID=2819238 RepID=A0A8A4ZGU0_9MICO|nr:hypothetical protein [Pengzhenrongella sicca]QTE30173.1 hypothetical protein J4E96_03925 [Pengzhenrongella sicca]
MLDDIWMHVDVQGELLESARDCEADVFLRTFGNSRAQLDDEYGAYEDSTVFLALADAGGDVVATVRLLMPGGHAGLKTLVDVGNPPWSADGTRSAAAVGLDPLWTCEVATLGVRRSSSANGTRLSLALYHGLFAIARVNRMASFVAILDERVRRLLGSAGILTRSLPGTRTAPYLGSPASTPVYAHITPLLENQRRQFPEAHRLVTLGIGLDGVAIPPSESFLLRPRVPLA